MEALIGAELVTHVDGKVVRKPTAEVLAGKKFVALYCEAPAAARARRRARLFAGGLRACRRALSHFIRPHSRLPARPLARPAARRAQSPRTGAGRAASSRRC